jgi:type IV pilus assembly protein PilA
MRTREIYTEMKFYFGKKNAFTLIELMVVVGIIGVISMIAIPNFQRFQSKAKQAHAKTELATIYGLEKAFHTEFGLYNANLILLGYTPDGVPIENDGCPTAFNSSAPNWPTRYYSTGFGTGAHTTPPPGIAAGSVCVVTQFESTVGAPAAAGTLVTASAGTTFMVQAQGNIGGSRTDIWTINQTKALVNTQVGF